MANRERDLDIDNPDDASEHCSTHNSHVSSLAIDTERLVVENDENTDKGVITGRTCKHISEDTSCSKTPSEMTGNEVRKTLNDSM